MSLNGYDDDLDDLLKGGDILILNAAAHPPTFSSCRRERRTCRSADGLEILVVASLFSFFNYPGAAVFDQPHTVERAPDTEVVGESARCFNVLQPITPGEERAELGLDVRDGLPLVLCYAEDGVPLRFGKYEAIGLLPMDAVELRRQVDHSVFDLPYPFVPSTYDRDED